MKREYEITLYRHDTVIIRKLKRWAPAPKDVMSWLLTQNLEGVDCVDINTLEADRRSEQPQGAPDLADQTPAATTPPERSKA